MIPSLTNPLVLCIVSALVLSCAVDIIVAVLTRRALSPELPPEFKNVYDAKEYARSQEYTKAKGTLGMVETVFDTSVMLAFLLCGGLAWLDTLSAGWSGNPILHGILFLGFLALAGDLLGLPFSVYHTFVLEERFGFNRSTWRTFLMDRIKGWAVGLVLGVPLLAAILWFFHAAGSAGWLYAWGATVAFLLVVQYLAPTVLLPLFNTFTPLEDGELRRRISEYARNAGFNLQGVYVMDGSRRSSKGNAFFTGFGNKKRIALFDTLIERHPCEEIVAVLAHEVGHYKRRHIIKLLALGIVKALAIFYLLSLLLRSQALFAAFGLAPSVHVGLLLFGMLFKPLSLALGIPANRLSRRFEREADAFAMRTTGGGAALAAALQRLSAHSLSNLTPHPLDVTLHYSHPPVLERMRELQQQ